MDILANDSNTLKRTKSKSTGRSKKSTKKDRHNSMKRDNGDIYDVRSFKNFFKSKIHKLEKLPLSNFVNSSSNIHLLKKEYYKEGLYEKYSLLLKKRKFKLLNNFDEKHSKKFLENKDKCLEPIILPDLIEDQYLNDNNSKKRKSKKNLKYSTQKNLNKYIIVISNYDDEEHKKNISEINKTCFHPIKNI